MNLLRGWDEVDENPMLLGLNDSVNHTEDLIKRLWSGKGDYDKIRRKVRFRLVRPPGLLAFSSQSFYVSASRFQRRARGSVFGRVKRTAEEEVPLLVW